MTADSLSLGSAELYFDYEPTVECTLNDVEEPPQNRSWTEPSKPESEDYPETVLIETFDSIEVQNAGVWSNYLNYDTTRRNRKVLYLGLLCLLVIGATLAMVLGVQQTQEDESRVFAAANDANDATNTGPSPTPSKSPSPSPTTTTASPTAEFLSPVSPSSGPTVSPTTEPSSAETSEPTIEVCTDMVQADFDCYLPQTTINIAFENCNPLVEDWIGIYQDDSHLDLNDLGNPLLWVWTCGSQFCPAQEVYVDTLPFGDNLEVGTYVAHLVPRNSGGRYASSTASFPFEVANKCTGSPTAEPSSAETSEPTIEVCTDMVQADSDCYLPQTTINIAFENCNPLVEDWIGIYQNDSQLDLNDLGNPLMWVWTCGSQFCPAQEVSVDTLPFGDDLEVGTYVAHLVPRNSGGRYASSAASFPFEVANKCRF